MFPVCTGMNRIKIPSAKSNKNVPRVYGDEPILAREFGQVQDVPRVYGDEPVLSEMGKYLNKCSPCVRG